LGHCSTRLTEQAKTSDGAGIAAGAHSEKLMILPPCMNRDARPLMAAAPPFDATQIALAPLASPPLLAKMQTAFCV
jgi:hypothetical protein